MKLIIATLASLLVAGTAHAVPGTLSFAGRLTSTGAPVSGAHDVLVELYPEAEAGTVLWSEGHVAAQVDDGLVYLELGSITPLDGSTLAGGALYLEVSVDGQRLSPRIPLRSVPYALRAAAAETIDRPDGAWNAAGIRIGDAPLTADESIHSRRVDANNVAKIEAIGGSHGEAALHLRTPRGFWYLYMDGANGNDFGNDAALGFYNGANRLMITSQGRVGIGLTTPSEQLEVAGAVRVDGITIFRKTGNNGTQTCSNYCLGPQWGRVGVCLTAKNSNDDVYVGCDVLVGSGHHVYCMCAAM